MTLHARAWLIAGLIAAIARCAAAQTPPDADPHQALLEKADPTGKPATISSAKPEDARLQAIAELGESPLAAVFEEMSPSARAFAQHNLALSNPFFEGRVPGSRGNVIAAEYIEYYFRQAGLSPAFAAEEKAADGTAVLTPASSYRQPFTHGSETSVHQAAVEFDLGGDGLVALKPAMQLTVLGSSGSGSVKGSILLVGYGIESGPEDYSGFPDDTDLSGQVAVVMRFEPMNADGSSRFAKSGWSAASALDRKLRAIADRKAAAIVVINPPGTTDPRAATLIATRDSRPTGEAFTIPVVMVEPSFVERLIQAHDPTDGPKRTLLDFRKRFDAEGGAIPFPGATVSITTRISVEPVVTDNVGAVLPGRGDLKDQYLVIGAHYDHVGYGPVGTDPKNNGKLHPGADDNGSGTSGLLVVADALSRAYAELPSEASARSILFIAFSAEESGLNGSQYFVSHPSIPLASIDLMLNMDMIGRLRQKNGLEVQGTQSANGLYDWLKPHFDAFQGQIAHGSEVAGNSDHASFYQKKLPVLFFFTGLHREYHTPQDTGFTINQVGAGKVIDLVTTIGLAAAQRPERWKFTPRRSASSDPVKEGDDPRPTRSAGRVRFGIAPGTYSDSKPGIEVGDVYEGTSAADAGIKIGDRMIKWNGEEIKDVESWMRMLGNHKVGDEVDVTLFRDGKEVTQKVKLKAR